ncbi:AAA family ATPase [Streptomyces erythrochromogenes]|uniref:AAA family ATPase n=1 Tax=Streptomyces erythrochromogenes TaxID=285574 RepID=UPI0036BE5846
MITKITIGGFKSFQDFELDLAPCTVLTGRASAGRSNLFDALSLMSRTLLHGFDSAVALTPRLAPGGLFHQGTAKNGDVVSVDSFRVAVEMKTGESDAVVELVVRRGETPKGPTAVLDQEASGIWGEARRKVSLSGEVPADVLEEVAGWAAPVSLGAIGVGGLDMDAARKRALLGDLAALVHGCSDVRVNGAAVEFSMERRGWVAAEYVPTSTVRTLSVLAAAHGGSRNVLLLDGLEEGIAPSGAATLADRFGRRLSAGGPQLIVSTYALPVIEALETSGNAAVVVVDMATRIVPQVQASEVSLVRHVRDPYPEEHPARVVRRDRLARFINGR